MATQRMNSASSGSTSTPVKNRLKGVHQGRAILTWFTELALLFVQIDEFRIESLPHRIERWIYGPPIEPEQTIQDSKDVGDTPSTHLLLPLGRFVPRSVTFGQYFFVRFGFPPVQDQKQL